MREVRVLLLLLAASAPLQAQQVQVTLTPNGPTVGDRVDAVISLSVRAGDLAGEPRFPVWGETWGEAAVLAHSEPRSTDGPDGLRVYEQRLTLAAFNTGSVALPPAAIAVPLRSGTVQASTPAGLAIAVRSILPTNAKDAKDLKPKTAKPLVGLPVGEAFWWTLAGMLAAGLGVGLLLWRQSRKRPAAAAPRPALTPLAELAASLERLMAEPSPARLHTGLSLAFRLFLTRALGFDAETCTTSEVQRNLLAGRLPAPLVRRSVELLRACDMVKFARQDVDAERCRERLDTARRLGIEIDERTRPAEALPLEAAS